MSATDATAFDMQSPKFRTAGWRRNAKSILSEPCGQNHRGFEKSGDSRDHYLGSVDSLDQPFVAWLPKVNGNDGGTVMPQ